MKSLRKIALVFLTGTLFFTNSSFAFAGQWQKQIWDDGSYDWWYENDDLTYKSDVWLEENGKWYYFDDVSYAFKNVWAWIDGDRNGIAECYYFGSDCALYVNTTTPDGKTVNENGAWTVNGVVQTKNIMDWNAGNDYIWYSQGIWE